MGVREKFDSELENLKTLVINMATKAEQSLLSAMKALVDKNEDLALQVIDNDHNINRLDEKINETAIWLIAKQQPVATDLRKIISSLKIANDLERIGDQAVNIAVATVKIANQSLFKPLEDIPKMSERVLAMINGSIKAYKTDDLKLAKQVADEDNAIDEMYDTLIQELLQKLTESPELTNQITQLSFICLYLERIADHVTNICEHMIFALEGTRVDLNR